MTTENPIPVAAAPHLEPEAASEEAFVGCEHNIVEIRTSKTEFDLVSDIKNGLRPAEGQPKTLPTLLLYDAPGLKLFEKITYLNEYYLTNTEIAVLEEYADNMASRIANGSILVELGSGNLRKIEILLAALERAQKNVEYFALDVSLDELQRTLSAIPKNKYKYVKCSGLHGTYDDGLEWLKSPLNASRPKSVLSIGSSVGNFDKAGADEFLTSFASTLQAGDCLIVGIDSCTNPGKVYHAYNDEDGTTHEFILNGLRNANGLLKSEEFKLEDWRVIGEYRYDIDGGRHVAFVSPVRDVVVDGVKIFQDEKIQIEQSNKFSLEEAERLFQRAGLKQGPRWSNQQGDYALHMAYKPTIAWPTAPTDYAAAPVPSLADWEGLWAVWDTATRQMIPKEELQAKPIKLRNPCIFYLGHIPTFLDIHLSKATGVSSPQLDYYQRIFERGIDPDVDNPELCHDHSETPENWPAADEIIAYGEGVRSRVKRLLNDENALDELSVRKALWIGFEHEAMHLETLLYMLVQSDKTLPPEGVKRLDFEAIASEAAANTVANEWVGIPSRVVNLGLDDKEDGTGSEQFFGWDNEQPQRRVEVRSFSAASRAITNREFAEYLQANRSDNIPASWSRNEKATGDEPTNSTNGYTNGDSIANFVADKFVRSVFGHVPLRLALDWPVMASYDELAGCARWMGGRIPTEEEARSIYDYAQEFNNKREFEERTEGIPAVNAHLVNEGVQETPPQGAGRPRFDSAVSSPKPTLPSLFVDLKAQNVGLKNWHPLPVTAKKGLAGQSDLGGVWEWTSTVLEKHEGFEPMELYPGYTADFFDGKHNIVLGGSWATHPRIAGRKSFVNWYQRNYPFVWAGARLVKDN